MKVIKLIAVMAFTSTFIVGCACTQRLPSVTLGGAANKDAVLDMSLSKKGLAVTAPLVNVDVPFPSVKVED